MYPISVARPIEKMKGLEGFSMIYLRTPYPYYSTTSIAVFGCLCTFANVLSQKGAFLEALMLAGIKVGYGEK